MDLPTYLQSHARDGLITWTIQVEAAARYGLPLREVEAHILEEGLLPARYQRNRKMFSVADQLRLFRSRVAVIGCGGLGGYLLEELARLGIGQIVAIDPDVFEEHNLNRQLLSTPERLGQAKVAAAAERIRQVNPAVTLTPQQRAFDRENGIALLAGVEVAVDGLDNITARLALAECCEEARVPMVHGAIAGWYGQVTTQLPGDRTLQRLHSGRSEGKGVEQDLGNPSFTPAVIASLQVAEVCKVLLGRGRLLRGQILHIDLLDTEFFETGL